MNNNLILLASLEITRDSKRKELGKLTFDCFQLKEKGDRAYCIKGHPLGRANDGTVPLRLVLGGLLARVCKDCKDYDGG